LLPVGGLRILDRLVATFGKRWAACPLLVANAPGAAEWRTDLRSWPTARVPEPSEGC
jgi:hypothetical protein